MHRIEPRLMCIAQKAKSYTLATGETVKGHVNYFNDDGIELIVGQDTRWIAYADLKRNASDIDMPVAA